MYQENFTDNLYIELRKNNFRGFFNDPLYFSVNKLRKITLKIKKRKNDLKKKDNKIFSFIPKPKLVKRNFVETYKNRKCFERVFL